MSPLPSSTRRHGRCAMLLLPLISALLLLEPTMAFLSSSSSSSSLKHVGLRPLRRRAGVAVRMQEKNEGGNDGKRDLDRLFEDFDRANTKSSVGEALKETMDRLPLPTIPAPGSQAQPARPFRFPAYGFLLIAGLLAISFTGSLTELATGSPLFGKPATLAIIAAAGPGFIAAFVVAVQRYTEEGEEDNRRLQEEEEQGRTAQEKELPAIQGPVLMNTEAKGKEDAK